VKPVKNSIGNYQEKKDRSLAFLTVSILALFVGLISTLALYSVTLIDLYTISKFWIGFTIVGFLIPLKYYQKWCDFIKYEMIIFNVLGVGPFLMALFLTLNYAISTDTISQKYKVEKLYYEGDDNAKYMGVILEGNIYSGVEKVTGVTDIQASQLSIKPFLQLTISKGIFGFEVLKEKEFTF
jgi:hypothetical protein